MTDPEDLELTRKEWSLILDALNGTANFHFGEVLDISNRSKRAMISMNVQDHITYNRADLRHGADADVLLTRLAALSDDEFETIWAVAEGFWAGSDPGGSRIPGKAS